MQAYQTHPVDAKGGVRNGSVQPRWKTTPSSPMDTTLQKVVEESQNGDNFDGTQSVGDGECPWEESSGSRSVLEMKKKEEEKPAVDEKIILEDPGISHSVIQRQIDAPKGVRGHLRRTMRCYYELWKTRLSSLILLTTMGAYYSDGGWSQSWKQQTALAVGTFLQSASANSFNELMEVELDSKMNRTKSRPLPTGRISCEHAFAQAVVIGSLGTFLLYRYNNPKTALLGAANIFIYAIMYTPLKVRHWFNTWVGTIPGCIPPLMGNAAATNIISSPTAIYNAGLLYFWQIVHFMAIGYKCKGDYKKAGYKMLPIDQPRRAASHMVIHSALLFPLCWSMGPAGFNVAPWWFVALSTPINYYLLFKPSLTFYRNINYDNATKLFFKTLGHLSLLFITGVAAWCTKDVSWGELISSKLGALVDGVSSIVSKIRS